MWSEMCFQAKNIKKESGSCIRRGMIQTGINGMLMTKHSNMALSQSQELSLINRTSRL